MNYKKDNIPKYLLNALIDEISRNMRNNEGRLSVLEIFEEIPIELRRQVLQGFFCKIKPPIIDFFYLLQKEYDFEYENEINRSLLKFRLAGNSPTPPIFINTNFYKAYIKRTRHTGKVTLNVLSKDDQNNFTVECFYLAFNSDGIHSYFIMENFSESEFRKESNLWDEMQEINYQECTYLIQEAYGFNREFMSRPALGKFLYGRFLEEPSRLNDQEIFNLIRKISEDLSPRQLINTFFYALKFKDLNYVKSMLDPEIDWGKKLPRLFNLLSQPGVLMLEGKADNIEDNNQMLVITAHTLILKDKNLYQNNYSFSLAFKSQKGWLINNIEKTRYKKIKENAKTNPLNLKVYCRVYEILNLDNLLAALDCLDNIYELGELPYGIHMRISLQDECTNKGVFFMSDVYADLIINGDEFVLICKDEAHLNKLHSLIVKKGQLSVIESYWLPLKRAYRYLNGQYNNFGDILLDNKDDIDLNDNLCFLTVRYLLKNNQPIKHYLNSLKQIHLETAEKTHIYYQFDNNSKNKPAFFAEYVLENDWLTVSAFGDKDIALARKKLEKNFHDLLEFNGLEIKEEGIFDILTQDIKNKSIELERVLKDIYLNKWYYSKNPVLKGMSPFEASRSKEGNQLLWTMFKIMHGKKKNNYSCGQNKRISIYEYMQKITNSEPNVF